MRRLMLPALIVLVLSGCATVQAQYTSFGEADPARDAAIVKTYEQDAQARRDLANETYVLRKAYQEQHKDDAKKLAAVHVLVDTVPEGIKVQDGSLSVEKGAPYQLLGKMVLKHPGVTFSHEELIEEAKHLALAAGGNLVLLSYADAPETGKALGALGYVLKADEAKLDNSGTTSAQLPKPTQL